MRLLPLLTGAATWAIRPLRRLQHRAELVDQALELAQRDPLTGAYNRRALTRCFTAPVGGDGATVVVLVDLDDFKAVNDVCGHAAGDTVLVEVARRLEAVATAHGGAVIRMGGDEFLLAFPAVSPIVQTMLAAAVKAALDEPVVFGGERLHVSASLGTAAGAPGTDPEMLIRDADKAMYRVKRSSRTDSGTVDAESASPWARRRFLEIDLARKLERGRAFVAMLSVDRFAAIRLIIGAERSATLLRVLCDRVRALDPSLSASRLNLDTIGIGFGAGDLHEAQARIAAVREVIEREVDLAGHRLNVTVTTGLAGPGDIGDIRLLTEQAQHALDLAHANKTVFESYVPAAHGELDSLQLMSDLRRDLHDGQLWLCYQPKLRARTGEIDSLEALIRWRHPQLGLVPPGKFIEVSEQTGDIRAVTEWVIDRAIAEQALFAGAGLEHPVYINMSARLLSDGAFIERMVRRVSDGKARIGFEITETAVLDNPTAAIRNLQAISEAGMRIAIDDYGAGMSSLIYLKQLPADELKIDRAFVAELTSSHRDPLLVRSTIDLAHGLGMEVTAEGVDTPAAMALLRAMGCDLLQGYLIAKPMPAAEAITFLSSGAPAVAQPISIFQAEHYWSAASTKTA